MSLNLPSIISDKIEYYLNFMTVLEVEGDLFMGKIKTNYCQISWDYDDNQNCCESFDAISSFGDISNLVGKFILKKIDLVEVDDTDDCGAEWRLMLDENKYIAFTNIHNGYYSHNLDVTIDFVDQEKKPKNWNTSI